MFHGVGGHACEAGQCVVPLGFERVHRRAFANDLNGGVSLPEQREGGVEAIMAWITLEAVYSIMYTGEFRPSKNSEMGELFFDQAPII